MPLTHFFAEFYGLFLIIFSVSMYVHKEMYMELLHDLEHKRTAIYVLSVFGLAFGLLTILLHNSWQGPLLSLIVTLVGWVVLIKSTLYLSLPRRIIHKIVHDMGMVRNYHLYVVISLIIGLYLAINGVLGMAA